MTKKIKNKKSEKGLALLMVSILLFVMVIIVLELLSSAHIQIFMAENLSDEHMSFYSEDTMLIKIEEILFQDIEPPQMRDPTELGLTIEEMEILRKKKGTDSYHDYWASQEIVEQNGESWIRGTIEDEERKFNINTLIDPITNKIVPKRKKFLEKILEIMEIKRVDAQDIVTNISNAIDKDHTGKFDSEDLKNTQLSRINELLGLETIEKEDYYGFHFPEGEISTETEDDFGFEDEEEDFDSFDEEDEEDINKPPFQNKKASVYEEWENNEIKAGFKDIFTVYGEGKININTAPMPLLIALFGDEDAALAVLRARKKAPLNKLEDLRMITGASNAIALYGDMIGFHSDFYKIKMEFRHRRAGHTKYAMMKRVQTDIRVLFRGAN